MQGDPNLPVIIIMVAMGVGLAAASGFRVFVPLFVASLAIRSGVIPPEYLDEGMQWLGSTPALIVFGTACVVEIAAYYIPWLDNALDSVATPAAVVAGTLIAYGFAPEMSPALKWGLAVLAGGGSAAMVQTGTVATRGGSTLTTAGLANPLVSTVELGGALVLSILAILAPIFCVIVLLVIFILISRRVFRFVFRRRVQPV